MFTVEDRDSLRDHVLLMADGDERVIAGAAVGSLALGEGDRFSDLDLTFAVEEQVSVASVLAEWTDRLAGEMGAVTLTDLVRGPTTYRVLLFPDALQLDLSMTVATEFRPAGPRFRLLFGQVVDQGEPSSASGTLFIPTPAVAEDVLGWGIIYGLHARACIERGRLWQAEHYVGAVRDHGLSLACLRQGLPAIQARGYDQLPSRTLDRFEQTHISGAERGGLYRALRSSVAALLREAADAQIAFVDTIARNIRDLAT